MPITIVSGPTITAGQSLSSILNVSTGNLGVMRITMPNAWDNSAWLTFQISQDGATFTDLYFPNGGLVIVTVRPGSTVVTDNETWQAAYFKFRSGSPTSPIIQSADRIFSCVMS